jgi:hypothetical protein
LAASATTTIGAVHDDIASWFFAEYFTAFVAIGAGKSDSENILAECGVLVNMAGPRTHTNRL